MYKLLYKVTCVIYIVAMAQVSEDHKETAAQLSIALKHARSRLRRELRADTTGFTMTQLAILWHLTRTGPATSSDLATAEHITQQAISQIIPPLKEAGLIEAVPDQRDGRKIMLSITPAGQKLRESLINTRDTWLAHVIETVLTDKERSRLGDVIAILERLANA
jgi:DNA-binding MarR family transcriptional regulator